MEVIYLGRQPGSVTMPQQRYESVADDLRSKILSGVFPPGSQLPSRAQLAAAYDVSGSVIDKAMMLLRFAQLTETLPGVGVFVVKKE
jgi:DNA-binding GntR family transcriptional regulator